MPDGSRPAIPYPAPPSPEDERIVAAIRASRPEDIPDLAWTLPDFAVERHRIIRKFAIDRKKRPGGQFIACAMCSGGHPKFLSGSVLWSPDGKLRLIGHICAAREEHFGKAGYWQLLKRREQEEMDSKALAWVEVNIAAIAPVRASIAELRTVIGFWEEQQRSFFRCVGPLAERLAKIAAREGSILTVTQQSSSAELAAAATRDIMELEREEQPRYEAMAVGTSSGRAFLHRASTKRSLQLESTLQAFRTVPNGQPEQQLLALFDGGERAVTAAVGLVFQGMREAAALADDCADARAFFRADNLALLERWGGGRRNTQPFTLRRYASRVEFALPDRSRAALQTGWPQMPDLSLLRQLLDAGTAMAWRPTTTSHSAPLSLTQPTIRRR